MNFMANSLKKIFFKTLYQGATPEDLQTLDSNIKKHTRALLKCLLIVPVTFSAIKLGGEQASNIILYVSLAVQVAGLAWFVVTFAALPKRHLEAAIVTTESMFCSFLAGIFSVMTLATMTAPWSLLVLVPIYWWLYQAAVLYDSADALKIGKHEQELLAAQAIQRIEILLQEGIKAKKMRASLVSLRGVPPLAGRRSNPVDIQKATGLLQSDQNRTSQ